MLYLLLTNDPLSVSDCCVSVPFDSSDHFVNLSSFQLVSRSSARTAEVIPSVQLPLEQGGLELIRYTPYQYRLVLTLCSVS